MSQLGNEPRERIAREENVPIRYDAQGRAYLVYDRFAGRCEYSAKCRGGAVRDWVMPSAEYRALDGSLCVSNEVHRWLCTKHYNAQLAHAERYAAQQDSAPGPLSLIEPCQENQ